MAAVRGDRCHASSGRQAALEVGPDLGDAAVQVLQGAGVLDDEVGHGQALFAAGLGGQAGLGLLGRHAARADHPFDLEPRAGRPRR